MTRKVAIIIGAGPAGITAAYELLDKTDVKPVIFESTGEIGGLARTVEYRGNRIDIGPHRFFSKSSRVMAWWQNILPPQGAPAKDDLETGRDVALQQTVTVRPIGGDPYSMSAPDPERDDNVMLVRRRVSRIYFLQGFLDYPLSLDMRTISHLGIGRCAGYLGSYLKTCLFPIREERDLEDFFVNRFGERLYRTFFKGYTEKVWGVSCSEISPDWGSQRVKSLSITKAVMEMLSNRLAPKESTTSKQIETSLIRQFLYPKFGAGHLWTEAARRIEEGGGEIHRHHRVLGVHAEKGKVVGVTTRNVRTGETTVHPTDYLLSSMPVKDLITAWDGAVPQDVRKTAEGLLYRDFITVGLLLEKLRVKNDTEMRTVGDIIPDNWIYVQDDSVRLARIQVVNNASPYMIEDYRKAWVGLEYFCNEGDDLWCMSDEALTEFAIREFASIGFADPTDVLGSVVIRAPRAYPVYFGSYGDFPRIRAFLDGYPNLFLVGRNGTHRYNNMDHSMLTAMTAAENIRDGVTSKQNIWEVNAEKDYHEER